MNARILCPVCYALAGTTIDPTTHVATCTACGWRFKVPQDDAPEHRVLVTVPDAAPSHDGGRA